MDRVLDTKKYLSILESITERHFVEPKNEFDSYQSSEHITLQKLICEYVVNFWKGFINR